MNMSPKNLWPRETQTVRCCSTIYRRWRFVGGKFPRRFCLCGSCGQIINWPDHYKPKARKRINLDAYYLRSNRFVEQGLTTRGKPRVKKTVTAEEKAERRRRWWKARTAARHAAGLTSRGTPRLVRTKAVVVRGRYEEFRASLNIKLPEIMWTDAQRAEEAA